MKISVEVINLVSDSSQGRLITIFASNDPVIFVSTPSRAHRKIDKILYRITSSPIKATDSNSEQLISIIPESSSIPVDHNIQLLALTTCANLETNPEERQNKEDANDNIHTDEGADTESSPSTISALNTEDKEALNKNFD